MIKYFFRTFYRLPPSKYLLDSLSQIIPILKEVLASRPPHRKIASYEIELSCSCLTITTEELPEYQKIFLEKPYWNWADLDEIDKTWARTPEGEKSI